MSILRAALEETQMWAIYQMAIGKEMPGIVTKTDLTGIIAFLFKQLDWIDPGTAENESVEEPSANEGFLVEADSKPVEEQSADESFLVGTENLLEDDINHSNYSMRLDGPEMTGNTKMDLAEEPEPKEDLQADHTNKGDDSSFVVGESSKLTFSCSICDQKFSDKSHLAAHNCVRDENCTEDESFSKYKGSFEKQSALKIKDQIRANARRHPIRFNIVVGAPWVARKYLIGLRRNHLWQKNL